MTLRKKTIALIAVLLLIVICSLYVASETILLSGFSKLEDRETQQNVQRVVNSLDDELTALVEKTPDWAVWDDTYDYMERPNREYAEKNFMLRSFADPKLNFIILVTLSGEVALGKGYDLESGMELAVPDDLTRQLSVGSPLLEHSGVDSSHKGILSLHDGTLLVATRPIVTSEGNGPIRGTLLIGRLLTRSGIQRLSNSTRLSVSTYEYEDQQLPEEWHKARSQITDQTPIVVRTRGNDQVDGFTVVKDIYGKPCLLLRVESPRVIYQQGQTSLNYMILAILGTVALFSVAMLWLLERLILSRLSRLSAEVTSIGDSGDLSVRVTADGADELARLGRVTNGMLDALQESHTQLATNEQRYRAFLQQTAEGIWRCELDSPIPVDAAEEDQLAMLRDRCYVAEANEVLAMQEGFGRAEEMIGVRGCPLDHGAAGNRTMLSLIRSGYRLQEAETVRSLDGKVDRHYQDSAVGIVEEGRLTRLWGVRRDITEQRLMEVQLLRAQRLESVGRLAGQVAHDFNNLLGPLVGYPELIKIRLPEGHPAAAFCDTMVDAARQMAEINDNMLALGRRGLLVEQPVQLNRLVTQVVDQMSGRLNGVKVVTHLAADLLSVNGSSGQLSRVISNLLVNARDAIRGNGLITVATYNFYADRPFGRRNSIPIGQYVRLSVADSGCGIPLELQDKVFDAFFTTNASNGHRGSGLGLSIVQAIVEDHRGYVELESELDSGTNFSIYLPAQEALATPPPEETMPRGDESVLVVDDDPLQRTLIKGMLSNLGYHVDEASSGEKTIAFIKEHPVDLLLLDMVMPPGIDGAETYRRALEVRPHQKAIIVSGYAETDRVRAARDLGVCTYLHKPVTLSVIARAVRNELARVQ
ncbi:MAG TPA: CHASE4 domain-containing protein [Chloroflexota bacterium]|nr:CHASE4 domain-containing protein [Chloroflexota bacterium]